MITRSMKIRRQLRSARVASVSEEERRAAMREAEERGASGQDAARTDHEPKDAVVPPRISGG
jgi:hypothetical protein